MMMNRLVIGRNTAVSRVFAKQVAIRCIQTHATRSYQNASVNLPASTGVVHNVPVPLGDLSKLRYLKSLQTSQLISYGVIGLCTLNKTILDLVVKLFPYTPMFLVKAFVYKIYCGGESIPEVIDTGRLLSERHINNMMTSLSIEACEENKGIDIDFIVRETGKSITDILLPHTVNMIEKNVLEINSIPPGYVALKPTGLIDDAAAVLKNFDTPEYAGEFEKLVQNCNKLCDLVYQRNQELSLQYPDRVAPFLVATVDAEAHPLQRGVYELQRRLYQKYNPVGKPISVIGTIQMYLKESGPLLIEEQKLAMESNYRLGLKLVRGAYIHSEADRNVIHDTKLDTDKNYDSAIANCIDDILLKGDDSIIGHLVVASHNRESQFKATALLQKSQSLAKSNVVLAQLLGMADDVTFDLIENHGVRNIIKYVPWGPPKETKTYLHRRLEENGDAVRADNGWPLVKGVLKALISARS